MRDEELIKLITDDCEEGMQVLMRQYTGLVYTIVYSKIASVCSREDAEECASDVFMEFYRSIPSFNPEKGTVKAFLSVIAKRIAIARFRTLTRNGAETVPIEECTVSVSCSADSSPNRAVLDAVRSLGKPDSVIITKKFFCGETAKQIASELGMKEFAVHKRYERAMKKLRKILSEADYNG